MKIWLEVIFYSGIGCVCEVVRDGVATIQTKSIAQGKHRLAGNLDAVGDWVSIIIPAFSGVQLIHLGWRGWLGIIPIGLTGKLVTERASKWSHENIEEEKI